VKLNVYYKSVYDDQYNMSSPTFSTTPSAPIIFILTLYTNTRVTDSDLSATSLFIDRNISNDNYTVALLGFTSSLGAGTVDDLFEELLIIALLLSSVMLFCAVWGWRWYHQHFKGKGEVLLVSDYREYRRNRDLSSGSVGFPNTPNVKQSADGKSQFATIDVTESPSKSRMEAKDPGGTGGGDNAVEMVSADTMSKADEEANDSASDREHDGDVLEHHDEDEEKAEEIEFPNTTLHDGEEIVIEDDD